MDYECDSCYGILFERLPQRHLLTTYDASLAKAGLPPPQSQYCHLRASITITYVVVDLNCLPFWHSCWLGEPQWLPRDEPAASLWFSPSHCLYLPKVVRGTLSLAFAATGPDLQSIAGEEVAVIAAIEVSSTIRIIEELQVVGLLSLSKPWISIDYLYYH